MSNEEEDLLSILTVLSEKHLMTLAFLYRARKDNKIVTQNVIHKLLRVNFYRLKRILRDLEEYGLIKVTKVGRKMKVIEITDKGVQFVDVLRVLTKML